MKHFSLVAFLIAATTFAAAQTEAPPTLAAPMPASANVVRELISNVDGTQWALEAGWAWSNGALIHTPGTNLTAQQSTTPTLTIGRAARLTLTLSGRTQGAVDISFGQSVFRGYGQDGTFNLFADVTDPQATLTLNPTSDFDGTVSALRVVELASELVDDTNWTTTAGWLQSGTEFQHTPDAGLSLERVVNVVAGHTYQVSFSVSGMPNGYSGPAGANVSLGGAKPGWFGQHGNWNYLFDMEVGSDDRLVFTPQDPANASVFFSGTISKISVRELTTDAPSTAQVLAQN